ncbi:MAG: phage/plasmid primase, P4 family, partial [Clostridia bacterium]
MKTTGNEKSNLKGYNAIAEFESANNLEEISVLRRNKNGKIIISSTRVKDQTARGESSRNISNPFINELGDDYIAKPKKTRKKHKKKNKGKKKQPKYYLNLKPTKKKKGKKLKRLKEESLEIRKPNLSAILSGLLASEELVAVYDDKMNIFSDEAHCFVGLDPKDAQIKLMELLNNSERLCVTPRDVKNAFDTILMLPELQRDLSPRVNIPLVNCENGVLNVETMELLKHSPQFGFTSCINASLDEQADGNIFKQFLRDITDGDKDSKQLLQEIIGYSLSSYVNAKKAVIFYGVPNSGKSVLFNILERLVGGENVCHVDLQRLSEPCYAARLNKSKLNIAPDLPQTPIKDIGTFKSLVSSLDKIETKELYKNPKSQPCYCKMLFGANQFVPLNKLDANNAEAFFERLIIIPFLYAKPEEERDPNLPEKLWAERDYIFTWAMKGLKRLIENNFIFSSSKES